MPLPMNMLRSVSLLALSSAALSAHAVVLDFEDLSGGDDDGYVTYYASPVVTHGFSFSVSAPGSIDPAYAALGPIDYTGSVALFSNNRDTAITLTRVGGGTFDLTSLDLANLFTNGTSDTTVTFVGTRADRSTVSRTFVLDHTVDALQSVSFTGFKDVVSVGWQQAGNLHQFDNVDVTPTPGPVAALPFALMALRRRKRS